MTDPRPLGRRPRACPPRSRGVREARPRRPAPTSYLRTRTPRGSNQHSPVRRSNSHPCQGQRRISPSRVPLVMTGPLGHHVERRRPEAEGAALVRAAVSEREVLAADVEDADRAALHLDDLPSARRDLVDGRNGMSARRHARSVAPFGRSNGEGRTCARVTSAGARQPRSERASIVSARSSSSTRPTPAAPSTASP